MKKRKRYDRDFKRNAVELVLYENKSQKEVCEGLGISCSTLSGWKEQYLQSAGGVEIDGKEKSARDLVGENRTLREELEKVKRQRDILKKAMHIVSELPGRNML